MKKVVVHLGAYKTGTTAIQNWLFDNKEVLADAGVYTYNLRDASSGLLKGACHAYALGHAGAEERLNKILSAMAFQISCLKQDVVCITDEGLLGLIPGWSGNKYFEKDVYPCATEIIQKIESSFSGYEVIFCLYKRQERDWLTSCWKQVVKSGLYKKSFESFLNEVDSDFSWVNKISEIKSSLSNSELLVFDYEIDLDGEPREVGVIKLLGLGDGVFDKCTKEFKRINVSPSDSDIVKKLGD